MQSVIMAEMAHVGDNVGVLQGLEHLSGCHATTFNKVLRMVNKGGGERLLLQQHALLFQSRQACKPCVT